MRRRHQEMPFHRIERWVGAYFRAAHLWEVGVYLLADHAEGEPLCGTLRDQTTFLERWEAIKDSEDGEIGSHGAPAASSKEEAGYAAAGNLMDMDAEIPVAEDANEEGEDHGYDEDLDKLYDLFHGGAGAADPDKDDEDDSDEEQSGIGEAYLPTQGGDTPGNEGGEQTGGPTMPRSDSLQNAYVRVVNTNGLHHLALVDCGCRGNTHLNLIKKCLIPTSFKRYRTLFTFALLDDFRMSNLVCKTTAYQYYQKLRRITSPTAPNSVPNLYHELRRTARLWRWMKKIKWVGIGHRAGGAAASTEGVVPSRGSLAPFCAACPQPGINLPEDWRESKDQWVFQRFFVTDGNFKADHVRQPHVTEDIWLGEGGGMMTLRKEYDKWLQKAIETNEVRRFR